jgi:hypothetical protein
LKYDPTIKDISQMDEKWSRRIEKNGSGQSYPFAEM